MNLSTAPFAAGSIFAIPAIPGGTTASCLSSARTAFIVGVVASDAALTCQMSSPFDRIDVIATAWPPTSTTSNAHAECPPGDGTTTS